MIRRILCLCAVLSLASLFCAADLPAQSVCDAGNGPLRAGPPPAGVDPAQITTKFGANEAAFKAARENYGFTLDVSMQTLDNAGRPDGEYQQTSKVALNDAGKRVERTTFAPESTLRRLTLSEDDLDDIHQRLPFPLTSESLPQYSISYVGKQRVDELETFVFDAFPKASKKEKRLFQGRVWVDDQDLVIVKTCGKPRENVGAEATKRTALVNLAPVFVTFRAQVDGKFWFPAYARADEMLRFPSGFVHIREVVKYTDYKLLPHAN